VNGEPAACEQVLACFHPPARFQQQSSSFAKHWALSSEDQTAQLQRRQLGHYIGSLLFIHLGMAMEGLGESLQIGCYVNATFLLCVIFANHQQKEKS